MNILFWGLTLGVLGKLILGLAVLRVHTIIRRERKIDNVVVASIKREEIMTILGIVLIVLGYILEVAFYNGVNFFTCFGTNCAASLIDALQ